jgi:hypothetical protein
MATQQGFYSFKPLNVGRYVIWSCSRWRWPSRRCSSPAAWR